MDYSIIPVILTLIMIEGLLSVDNAMAIAALASHLPVNQQKLALRLGMFGAFGFRGLCMALAAFIIASPWLKIVGSLYLLYLMSSNLSQIEQFEEEGEHESKNKQTGFWLTIVTIELMDLVLSIDNIVAAVAIDPRLWVVITGVCIGIAVLRFLAGFCIKLIEKQPILEKAAFLLIGYIGCILLIEVCSTLHGAPIHVGALQKFVGICIILSLCLAWANSLTIQYALQPFVDVGGFLMHCINRITSLIFWPVIKIIRLISSLCKRKPISTAQPVP
jgi:tellurite resistance protein TerC